MSTSTPPNPPLIARLTSGNPALDEILGGGFPVNSINILLGEPGTGKTILAEHLIFANADPGGRPILFLTTLSEPMDKVVRYLQHFNFFDPAKIEGGIFYDTIGQDLVENGIAALVPRIKAAITELKPKIIVIDSFRALHDLSPSVPDMRRMLYELAGLLGAYETTAFFVGEYSGDEISNYPEFAVADGMVELARNKLGMRDDRYLRVLKLRGSSYLEGLHAFRISSRGLHVFPRLVSPETPPDYDDVSEGERVTTGVHGLDEMLQGGLRRGRSTFVLGPTGSGKTTLALQFALEGLGRQEKCLYVSFEENPSQLAAQIRSMGADVSATQDMGLSFLYVSPVELQIDSIISTIFRTIRDQGIRRVCVDAVGDLIAAANDVHRLHAYLYALTQHFAVMGVTSMFTYEVGGPGETHPRLSAIADHVLLLQIDVRDGRGRRTMRVVKARGVEHDLHVRELRITSGGVEVS